MLETNPESAAILSILEEEVAAWNKGDAEGFARHFAPDGTFTNIVGTFLVGHKNFLERHEQIFKGPFHNTVLNQELVSLQFIRPDVALVETLVRLSGFLANPLPGVYIDEQGCLYSRLLQVMVKDNSAWKIAAYHNVDVKMGIPVPQGQGQQKLLDEHSG